MPDFVPKRLPCGKCVACRRKQARDWTVRLYHESLLSSDAAFITLTYDPEHLPSDGSLQPKQLQKFWKRLRKAIPGKIRYYSVGEYGTQNLRPHYHAVVYGWSFPDRVLHGDQQGDYALYRSRLLESCWKLGFSTVQPLSTGSIKYVAGYVHKKLGREEDYERVDPTSGEVWDVQPEFARMSRKPGLGAEFFHRFAGDIYPSDFVVIDGQKYKPPRYYDKLLERSDPELLAEVKAKRREYGDLTETTECTTVRRNQRAAKYAAEEKARSRKL